MLDLIHEYLYTIESTGAGLVFLGNPWVWVPHVSLCKVPRHTLQCVSTDRTKPQTFTQLSACRRTHQQGSSPAHGKMARTHGTCAEPV